MIAEANWGRYFDRLQNPQVQMPKIDNRRQAESHPSLLEDGRGAKEEDDSQNCPTLSAVMTCDDPDGVLYDIIDEKTYIFTADFNFVGIL